MKITSLERQGTGQTIEESEDFEVVGFFGLGLLLRRRRPAKSDHIKSLLNIKLYKELKFKGVEQ